ncbi:MAG: hypothetical protein ABL876_07700, partial [Chitinophagaceae bacterium]
MGLANYMSRRSRAQTGASEETFLGEDKEWLIIYCKEILKKKKIDFFVFGHRHLAIDYRLLPAEALAKAGLPQALAKEGLPQALANEGSTSRYINLGDWIRYYTYAVFDGENLELKSYKGQEAKIIRN